MGSPINNTVSKQISNPSRGLVIELIGVAGVGKSTLYKALGSKNLPWLICDMVLPVWNISSAPFFFKNISSLAPLLILEEITGERLLKRREIAFMALLNGWHKILRKKADQQGKVILIDQGAISMMTYLSVWGPKSLHNDHNQSWWESIYVKWAQTLDILVYLDTKDEIIIDRIRTRSQDHHLKDETVAVMCDWIMKYRILYTQILNRFESNGFRAKVVRIDSGENSVEDIANIFISLVESHQNRTNL
jgi:thymidylate kinase